MLKTIFLFLFSTTVMAGPVKNCVSTFKTTATPGLLNIESSGGKCEGVLSEKGGFWYGSFKSKTSSYDTGISMRNKHFQEHLAKPEIILTFDKQKDDGELDATLTLNSDTKAVKVKYTVKGDKVDAKFSVDPKEFKSIGILSYLGVTAANTIDITVQFEK